VRKYDDKFNRVEGKDERNDGQKSWGQLSVANVEIGIVMD
jgi:hypothetical protein